jgi:hypothetical protein
MTFYGGGTEDFATYRGLVVPGAGFEVWDSATGGNRITDLKDGAGNTIGDPWLVLSDTQGMLRFECPSHNLDVYVIAAGAAPGVPRVRIRPADLTNRIAGYLGTQYGVELGGAFTVTDAGLITVNGTVANAEGYLTASANGELSAEFKWTTALRGPATPSPAQDANGFPAGLIFRRTDTGNLWMLGFAGNSTTPTSSDRLNRVILQNRNGGSNQPATGSWSPHIPPNIWFKLKVVFSGRQINAFLNDMLIASTGASGSTGSTVTGVPSNNEGATQVGLRLSSDQSQNIQCRNFSFRPF